MQIDLQEPLKITQVMHGNDDLKFEREGNVYWIYFAKPLPAGRRTGSRCFTKASRPKA